MRPVGSFVARIRKNQVIVHENDNKTNIDF